MIIVSTPKRELLYWITKLTTSGDTYYEVYDPSSSYYLLYGYDYDCNGDIVWSVWDMPGSEWIELEDGCVEATEVSGYIRGISQNCTKIYDLVKGEDVYKSPFTFLF